MGRPANLNFVQRLEIGKQFESKISRFLVAQGFPIGLYLSAKNQWEFGESAAHVEIKFDSRFMETGNVFIETAERRDPGGISKWREAGIYDASQPWFYLIGTEAKLWLVSVRWLQCMEQTGKYRKVETETATGFLLPVPLVDRIAIKIWENW